MISICHECKLERSLHNNYTVMGHISVCPTFVIYVEKKWNRCWWDHYNLLRTLPPLDLLYDDCTRVNWSVLLFMQILPSSQPQIRPGSDGRLRFISSFPIRFSWSRPLAECLWKNYPYWLLLYLYFDYPCFSDLTECGPGSLKRQQICGLYEVCQHCYLKRR